MQCLGCLINTDIRASPVGRLQGFYILLLLVLSCLKGLIPSQRDLCNHLIVDFRSFMS